MSKFRAAAVAAAAAGDRPDDHLEVMRPLTWLAGLAITGLLLAALVWSCFVRIPMTVGSRALLVAPGGVVDVVSDTTGLLRDLRVAVNDVIVAGAVLARVEQPDVELELRAAQGIAQDATVYLAQLRAFHERDRLAQDRFRALREVALGESIRLLEAQREAIAQRIEALRPLVGQQLVTRDRILAASAEMIGLQAQVEQSRRERSQLALEDETRRTQREQELLEAGRREAEAQRAADNIRARLERLGVVRATEGGRVLELKANSGDSVQRGTAILVVEQFDPRQPHHPITIAYLSPDDGKKVRIGQSVEVTPVTAQREEHGFIRGRVLGVAEVPASSAGMQRTLHNDNLVRVFAGETGSPYEVRIALETLPGDPARLQWSSPHPPALPVEAGTFAQVTITVRQVSLISLALPVLRRLFGIDLILDAI